ncbi:unnamed protein product [Nezara viridula]|uniref:Uncharacterized protein n=1 Tax=Nezara viridula TaxID=85310 RepID=A0A9P0HJ37_NEZVI|nr:unnamed protein product [Nezara viridula]
MEENIHYRHILLYYFKKVSMLQKHIEKFAVFMGIMP